MKYYVTADVHGYFSELKEAQALQDFVLDLLSEDQVILIRGNHEDLALELLHNWHLGSDFLVTFRRYYQL